MRGGDCRRREGGGEGERGRVERGRHGDTETRRRGDAEAGEVIDEDGAPSPSAAPCCTAIAPRRSLSLSEGPDRSRGWRPSYRPHPPRRLSGPALRSGPAGAETRSVAYR